MKTIIFIAAACLIFGSCSKESFNNTTSNPSATSDFLNDSRQVVYAIQTCDCENGGCGAQCAQTSSDDDCCMETACKCDSENFQAVLNELYSKEEIERMGDRPEPIKEPKLRTALIKDGFCIKQ